MSVHPSPNETDPDATAIRPLNRSWDAPADAAAEGATAAPRPAKGPGSRVIVAAVLATVVVALGALYLVGFLVAGDKLPRDAQVEGIAVGGLSRAAAIDKLTAELGPRAAEPLQVTAEEQKAEVAPADLGLQVDYAASVDAAGGGRSFNPLQILNVLTGGGPSEATVVTDETQLEAGVAALAKELDRKPSDAALSYAGTKVKRTAAKSGITVRQQDAASALDSAYLTTSTPVPMPADIVAPAVSTAAAAQVAKSYAEPAVSGPVRISAGGAGSFEITPAMIAKSLQFRAQDATLVPQLDAAELRSNAAPAVKKVELKKPRNATVRIVKGKPKVIPAVNGTEVGAEPLAKAVEGVLTKQGKERAAEVELTGAEAKFSTAEAEKLGIKEVTGQFTTSFPYLPYRNVNIGRAGELINNTLLKPGETFSLNKVVGERTRANGFTEGLIIQGGKFKRELGGGVSQSATTTFNAAFFAGLKDVEHQPHTLYINRYPAGREATVAWPGLDLKFTNDTDYGVLVQASVVKGAPGRPGSITVKMWSTKTYDKITSSPLRRSNFTTGRDIKDDSSDCEPMDPVQGFDVNYQRLFHRDGKVVKRENFHWRYAPTDRVTCV